MKNNQIIFTKKSHFKSLILNAVVIEVYEEEDGFENVILEKHTDSDFRDKIMNGVHPDDNFDNLDCIPEKSGFYIFDLDIRGGPDFNGEFTEYWVEVLLLNCRDFKKT